MRSTGHAKIYFQISNQPILAYDLTIKLINLSIKPLNMAAEVIVEIWNMAAEMAGEATIGRINTDRETKADHLKIAPEAKVDLSGIIIGVEVDHQEAFLGEAPERMEEEVRELIISKYGSLFVTVECFYFLFVSNNNKCWF